VVYDSLWLLVIALPYLNQTAGILFSGHLKVQKEWYYVMFSALVVGVQLKWVFISGNCRTVHMVLTCFLLDGATISSIQGHNITLKLWCRQHCVYYPGIFHDAGKFGLHSICCERGIWLAVVIVLSKSAEIVCNYAKFQGKNLVGFAQLTPYLLSMKRV